MQTQHTTRGCPLSLSWQLGTSASTPHKHILVAKLFWYYKPLGLAYKASTSKAASSYSSRHFETHSEHPLNSGRLTSESFVGRVKLPS